MLALISASLDRQRTVLIVLLFIFLAGAYAYATIPKESSPDINIPLIYVSMSHDGISPDDAERLLIKPMEEELSSIEGTKEMRATGYQGGANIVMEFTAGFDADKALDDVRLAVDKAKPNLPGETDEPTVSEVNFSLFPVLVVTLSGEIPERTLLKIAKNLQDKIENLGEVLEAPIVGEREEQIEIVINPALVASYGLNTGDIINFFGRSDRLVAAGNLDTGKGRFAIKVPGTFESVGDIKNMPLKAQGDSVVRVGDMTKIRRNFKDPESFARLDGQKALAIEVVKRTGENVIETIEMVKEIVEEESSYWPAGVQVSFTQDNSEDIKDMLSDLQNNILSAIILVMVVCVAALGLSSALLVGIAIPGAFLSGVLIIFSMGMTVNVVVLFALILSVGMLVDGAIVVTEYADRRIAEGASKKEAYGEAAKRMAWPIISSTATTLAAFCPLLFWPGTTGQFMKYMPITLIAVLSSSLLMALVFVPVLGSIFGRSNKSGKNQETDPEKIKGLTGKYVSVLKLALRFPGTVLIIAFALLIGVQTYYANNGNGVKFFPDIEPKNASVLVRARGNLSIIEQDALMKQVEMRTFDVEGIKTIYTRTGNAGSGSDYAEDVIGVLQLEFLEWDQREPSSVILDIIRDRTSDIAGIYIETRKQEEGPPTGKALQLQISSRYPALLIPTVSKIREGLEEIGGFVDIEDSRPLPGIEWELKIDRAQAAKFGADTSSIGEYVRLVTNGLKITEYRPNDTKDEIDVIARYDLDTRSLDQLDNIRVEIEGHSIPISNFVTRVPKQKTGTIDRADGYRVMTVQADVPEGVNVAEKTTKMEAWLKENMKDPRVKFKFQGEDEEQKEASDFLVKAFGVALFIMAIILVTQFNSFYSALLILSAVIMSTIGVMMGLLITGSPFGIVMTGIGVIALAGIIVNNNIVLIDTFDQLMATGKYKAREAILRTGAQRLRPVLLTTVTTVLGLLPMVLQINIDFFSRSVSIGAPSTQWWVELANAVAFGLIFSTPLTLVVTPSALMLREKAGAFWQRITKRWKKTA